MDELLSWFSGKGAAGCGGPSRLSLTAESRRTRRLAENKSRLGRGLLGIGDGPQDGAASGPYTNQPEREPFSRGRCELACSGKQPERAQGDEKPSQGAEGKDGAQLEACSHGQ